MSFSLAPKVTANTISANTRAQNADQSVLVIAQLGTSPSTTAGLLYQNVPDQKFNTVLGDFPPNSPEKMFGEDSPITVIVRKFREINKVTPIDVIPVTDPETTEPVSAFTVVGPATSDGVLTIQVGSPDYEYNIPITNADTDVVIATAIEAAINAEPSSLVTASRVTQAITLNSKYSGEAARNLVTFRITNLTATGVTFDAVELNPPNDILFMYPGLLDPIGNKRYQTIICPFGHELLDHPESVGGLSDVVEKLWNVDGLVQDTMFFSGATASRSGDSDPIANALPLLNEQQLTFFSDISPDFDTTPLNGLSAPLDICNFVFDTIESIVAKLAAIRSLRLTPGESIAQFVDASNGPLDSFGGAALASKPYFNMPLPGITLVDKPGYGFDQTEIDNALDAGAWTIGANQAGSPITGEVPTTYKTDIAGNDDVSYKFLNYVDTISSVREYFFNNLISRFAQSRLTNGDVIRGRDMANQETIAVYCELLYQDLSGPDFVLVEAGESSFAFFKRKLVVTIDTATGRATVDMVVPIVTQLREILATIQLSFGTEG